MVQGIMKIEVNNISPHMCFSNVNIPKTKTKNIKITMIVMIKRSILFKNRMNASKVMIEQRRL